MKIMFLIGSLGKGGAERVVCNLSNSFAENHSVFIVKTIEDTSAYHLESSIKVFSLDKDNSAKKNFVNKNIFRLTRLKKIVKEVEPNIIISFLPEPTYRILLLKKSLGIPVIVSVRNDPKIEFQHFVNRWLMKLLYCKADGFVFQTHEAQQYFCKKIKHNSTIIFNPIEDKFLNSQYKGSNSKIIVNVGRLNEQKNQSFLIKVFKKVLKKYPDYKLYIYGDGNLKDELNHLIRENKLQNKVILKGCSDDLEKEISDKKLFVLSSNYEGMPNALMEAMAVGLPCISTNCPCGGPKELIGNNENGILVNVNDEVSMYNAIVELISNNDKIMKLSSNAKKYCQKYNKVQISNEWLNYIEKVIKNAKNY